MSITIHITKLSLHQNSHLGYLVYWQFGAEAWIFHFPLFQTTLILQFSRVLWVVEIYYPDSGVTAHIDLYLKWRQGFFCLFENWDFFLSHKLVHRMLHVNFSVLNKFKGCPNAGTSKEKRFFFFFTPFFNIKHCLENVFSVFQRQHFLSSHKCRGIREILSFCHC